MGLAAVLQFGDAMRQGTGASWRGHGPGLRYGLSVLSSPPADPARDRSHDHRGVEVDQEGVEITPKGADEWLHLIDRQTITGRCCLTFHPKYGHLVPALEQRSHGA
jgi:hypothetical protein